MRASYQGSEILNQFAIKIAQFLDNFLQIAASRHYLFAKSVFLQNCKITSVTHINLQVFIFLGSSLCTGSPSQKFNSHWVEAFTLLRNSALSLSFGIIRLRYKQKTRQQRSHVSLMDPCLTRLIEGTIRRKTYCTLVRYVGMVRFKN